MALIPQSDEQYLTEKGFQFEIKQSDKEVLLVLKNWSLPDNYTPTLVDLLIRIVPGYPLAPLDMFWTFPAVKLAGGGWPLNADVHQQLDGRSWQRWSRHYEWRPGVDNIRTFITGIKNEISLGR
jgi:hypothetical protein